MTDVYHFTHVDNLAGIIADGLVCDTDIDDALTREVGNRDIKARRRGRPVKAGPGGVVADYVPFYFAPRSPMLYAIHVGNVAGYADGIDPLIYLVSSVDRLISLGRPVVTTDRNAALAHASHADGNTGLADIDWDLMRATYWADTAEEPDRRERRMAECLVHRHVPWTAFTAIHSRTRAKAAEVDAILAAAGEACSVSVTPGWYF